MVDSPVQEFYRDKNIFVTGATGFLGIALVEKLLRTCDVGTVYLLMRPKKGKEISTRLEELTKNLIFEKLKEKEGDRQFGKLVAIAGDVGEENLGLSPKDRQTLVENVDVVFHSAATLDFEAGLKPTVSINLLGTRRIVELCLEMRKIKALVHVSSAYVNSNRDTADEIIYDVPGNVDHLINLTTTLTDEALEEATPNLLGNHPNTYTITKAFAEHEVAKSSAKFPSAIVRPSMMAAWKEPVPGWTISKNGPQGFIMGAAKGVVRRLPVKKDLVYDYIPVDIVVNNLIVAGWHAAVLRSSETQVFHCTSSTSRPFTWHQIEDKINKKLTLYPLKSAVWYPTMKLLPSLTLFKISAVIFHFIPAFFLDFMLRMTGGRPILVRLHTNVSRSLGRLAPFIFREWFFDNSKTMALYKTLSEADKLDPLIRLGMFRNLRFFNAAYYYTKSRYVKDNNSESLDKDWEIDIMVWKIFMDRGYREIFNLDIGTLDWVDFFTNLVLGVRRYLNNEEMRTLPAAKKKNQILYVLNILIQSLLFFGIWYLTSAILRKTMMSVVWVLPVAYALYSIL